MNYQDKFEVFKDGVEFTFNDPCIWVVYPAGGAGDLIASIINFHYARTACHYFGFLPNGRVIFRPTDSKIINLEYDSKPIFKINHDFIFKINHEIGLKNMSWSQMDQAIFANHAYQTYKVKHILALFPKSRIIRILPNSLKEQKIIQWLSEYKNNNKIVDWDSLTSSFNFNLEKIHNSRLLEIKFGDLLNEDSFEKIYSNVLIHLDLPYKLIRYDFINYWKQQQHPLIRNQLE